MYKEKKQTKQMIGGWRSSHADRLNAVIDKEAAQHGSAFTKGVLMDHLITLGLDAFEGNEKVVAKVKQEAKPKASNPEKWNKKRFADELIKLGADESHVNDWMTSRKTFTETSFKSTIKHINNTNQTVAQIVELCAEKGWQGFDAKYLDGINRTVRTRGRQQVDQSGFGDEPGYIDGEIISNQQGFLNHE